MTPDDESIPRSAPAVVPRWEWRTVGDLEGADEALAFLQEAEPAESDETYLLSMYGDASVKVRDGLLDVKVLQQVNGAGLQLWVPTMKAPFPLDDDAVATVLDALGAPPATSGPSASTLEELVEGLIGSRDDLRAVEVHKSRRRAVLDDCMVELTVLTVEGTTTSTAVVEAPDPALVSDTVRRLGLDGRANVPVARGLKSALGWGPTRYAVVDVGTNSVKFSLGDRVDGVPHNQLETAVVTRLGDGLAQAGELTPDAMSAHGRGDRRPGRRRPPRRTPGRGRRGHRRPAPGPQPGHLRRRRAPTVCRDRRGDLGPGGGEARLRGGRVVAAAGRRPAPAGVRLRRWQQPVHLRQPGPDRRAVQPRRGRGALHRALRPGPRGAARDGRRRARGDRSRPGEPGRPADAGPGGRDRRHVHQPGGREPRPGHLRPRRRPRDRRHHGRGGPSDRGVPAADRRRAPRASPVSSPPGPR